MSDEDLPFERRLLRLHQAMPKIRKTETATVKTQQGGEFRYSYASLADIYAAVAPILSEHGFVFWSQPTLNENGRFVLSYTLVHELGGRYCGEYPLTEGQPQAMGSQITYARRYALTAVLGLTPDDDDDGQAWQQQAEQPARVPYVSPSAAPIKRHAARLGYDSGRTATEFVKFIGKLWDESSEEERAAFAEELAARQVGGGDVGNDLEGR